MKDSKFEVGDRVRVRRPNDVSEAPKWTTYMNKFDGEVDIIESVFDGSVHIVITLEHGEGYGFNAKWLTLVGSIEGMCQDCGSEMKDVQLFTSITKICPKCGK
jgi:hypothetical protein